MSNVKAIKKSIESAEPIRPRFELVPFDQIELTTTGNYVVKGLIPAEGLTVAWGPPKCGKSFWSFDLGCHVALGWNYRGRRVAQGPVVYVALEGGAGFGARAEAFRQGKMAEDHEPFHFYLITDRLDLIGEHETLIARIRDQLGDKYPRVVFIDTLNRSLAGSESSDEDMSAYIRAADAIREELCCAVVIVHHCGIDTTRPRGHTSLAGAVDAQIAVKRDPKSMTFSATVEFMKDGSEGDVIGNELEVIEIGTDDDGDEMKSCVVREAEATAPTQGRLNPKQRRAIEALHTVTIDHGRPSPGGRHYPPNVRVVDIDLWKEHLFSCGVLNADASNPRRDFIRLKGQLADKGEIAEWEGDIWAVKDTAALTGQGAE